MKTKHATTNYKSLAPFIEVADKYDGYAKFISDGFMDLTIERLWYEDPFGNPVYSICHWGEQNGDAMRDPEVTFGVNHKEGTIIPLSFENSYLGYYEEVFNKQDGKLLYNKSSLSGIDDFLWSWLSNIAEQGFTPENTREEAFV